MNPTIRRIITTSGGAVALILATLWLAQLGTHPQAPATVADTVTLAVSDTPADCQEDDACWNPCTMGVDGSASDDRYHVPGPCTPGTELPHGARFVTWVTPDDSVSCDATGWYPATVVVDVVDSAQTVLASQRATTCFPPGVSPFQWAESALSAVYHHAAGSL